MSEPERARPPVLRRARVVAVTTGVVGASIATLAGAAAGAMGEPRAGALWTVPPVGGAHTPVSPLLAVVAFWAGLLLLLRAWLQLRRLARQRAVSVAGVVLVALAWSLPLLIGPPVASRDVYSYAAQGVLVERGLDPYESGPAVLVDSPVLDAVDPLWQHSPAPYGPAFLALAGRVAGSVGDRLASAVLGFRALSLLGLALLVAFLPRLARRHGADERDAMVLAVANPLTLVHLVSGAHNESLMIGLLVAGLSIAHRWRMIGIAVVAVAAAVKAPAVAGCAFIGWNWHRFGRTGPTAATTPRWVARLGGLLAAAVVTLAVLGVAGQLTGFGWGWVDAATESRSVRTFLSVPSALGALGAGALSALGSGVPAESVVTVAEQAGLVAAVAVGVLLLARSSRDGLAALGWALVVVPLLLPATQPWYLLWGVGLVAAARGGRPNRAVVVLAAVLTFAAFPAGPHLEVRLLEAAPPAVIVGLAALLLPLTFRSGRSIDDEPLSSAEPSLTTVVVPTRHEADNIEPLVSALHRAFDRDGARHELVFVDDSDDDTPAVIAGMAGNDRLVRLVHRPAGERVGGLSGAVVRGLTEARGDVVVVMDGDLQHPPALAPALADGVCRGADLCIASRYRPGGHAGEGFGRVRLALSRSSTLLARAAFPQRLRDVTDPMSGFFAVRRSAVRPSRLAPDGFKILLELAATHDLAATEVPFRFGRRAAGASKAHVETAVGYGRQLVTLRVRSWRPWAGYRPLGDHPVLAPTAS